MLLQNLFHVMKLFQNHPPGERIFITGWKALLIILRERVTLWHEIFTLRLTQKNCEGIINQG